MNRISEAYPNRIFNRFLACILIFLIQGVVFGQLDYRTRYTDNNPYNWNAATNWQVYSGGTWITATQYPGQTQNNAGTVTIRNATNIGNLYYINAAIPYAIGNLVVGVSGTNSATLRFERSGNYSLAISGNLSVNFLLFSLGNALFSDRKQLTKQSLWVFGVLSVPIILSVIIYRSYKEKGAAKEVLIIHPSTDCSDVKYRVNIYELMDNYLKVMLPQLTSRTEYVVLPETAVTNAGWVADLNNNLVFDHFREATAAFTGLKLVTGAIIYESIPDITRIKGYQRNPGIRYSEKYKAWYYTYNSALFIEKNFPVQMRTKDGLVPYQEYVPYPGILPKLSPVGIDFQFSKREKNRVVFMDENRVKTASLICYELAYGNLFAKAVRNGAQALFVLMNEGWYVSEPKVKYQFLQLSVVRAIENRRDIAHASNMGISAFIDQRGIIVAQNNRITPSFLKQEIRMNKQHTMASAMGNYPAAIALVTVTILMISELIRKTSLRKKF